MTDGQTDRQTDRQTDGRTDGQTDGSENNTSSKTLFLAEVNITKVDKKSIGNSDKIIESNIQYQRKGY